VESVPIARREKIEWGRKRCHRLAHEDKMWYLFLLHPVYFCLVLPIRAHSWAIFILQRNVFSVGERSYS